MARLTQQYRILQTPNQRLNLGFGRNGQFEILTRFNGVTDGFTLSVIRGTDYLLNEQALLPGIVLNLFAPRCTMTIGGNLWLNVDYTPSHIDVGGSVQLIYGFD